MNLHVLHFIIEYFPNLLTKSPLWFFKSISLEKYGIYELQSFDH